MIVFLSPPSILRKKVTTPILENIKLIYNLPSQEIHLGQFQKYWLSYYGQKQCHNYLYYNLLLMKLIAIELKLV